MKKYFDAIYVINLPSRKDRKAEMLGQLAKVGLTIDGDYVRLFPAARPTEAAGFPNIGTRGCFLSHLGVLQEAHARGVKSVLILEDDCNFVSNIVGRLEDIFATEAKYPWCFFYGGALNDVPQDSFKNGYVDPEQGVTGAHFLAVGAETLASLIAYLEAMLIRAPGDAMGGPMHVDGAYSWFRAAHPEASTLLAFPEIAYQRSSATDIHKRKWYENTQVSHWILQQLRRGKNLLFDSKR